MEPITVIDIGRQALMVVIMLAGPMLLVGLLLGIAVGVFQAVTQINEATLTFIPKFLGISAVLLFLMPWMIALLTEFTYDLFHMISQIGLR